MGPQWRSSIFVGYVSPTIFRYFEPQTDDMFTTHFTDCHFNEDEFPELRGGIKHDPKDITWCTPSLVYLCLLQINVNWKFRKLYIYKIWQITYQMRSRIQKGDKYILATSAPSRVEIPRELDLDGSKINEPKAQLKRGRPIGSKDKNLQKKKKMGEVNEKVFQEKPSPHDDREKYEISINYPHNGIIWDSDSTDDENGIFSFSLSKEVDQENDEPNPKTLSECQKRPN